MCFLKSIVPVKRSTFTYRSWHTFLKAYVISDIWKHFGCVLRGVRVLLAYYTWFSATSETSSYLYVLASFGSILESQWVGDWVMFLRFGKSFPRVLLIFLSRLLARFLLPILSSLSKLHHLAHLVCQFLLFLFLPWIGEANCKSFTLVWSEGLILQQRETRYQNIESRTPSNNGLPLF